jgi:ABC-type glutathione transport system ATPase component
MFLLEVDDLRYAVRLDSMTSFRKKNTPLLRGVSFHVDEGESVALLGGSGSGKTTLARCIAGLQKPDAGSMFYKGINIFPRIENRLATGVEIQILFQASGASLDPRMTVLDSLSEGIGSRAGNTHSRAGNTHSRAGEAGRLVSSVGLPGDCLGRFPSQLSGGQRQRVALARLLAVAPRLMLLDEPTSALDALTAVQLLRLLKSLQAERGFSLLVITHDVRTALAYCDRVAVLHDGLIVEEGPGADVSRRPQHEYTKRLLKDSNIVQ